MKVFTCFLFTTTVNFSFLFDLGFKNFSSTEEIICLIEISLYLIILACHVAFANFIIQKVLLFLMLNTGRQEFCTAKFHCCWSFVKYKFFRKVMPIYFQKLTMVVLCTYKVLLEIRFRIIWESWKEEEMSYTKFYFIHNLFWIWKISKVKRKQFNVT